jgi:hypothetical protein
MIERAALDYAPRRIGDELAARRQMLVNARAEALVNGDAESVASVREAIRQHNDFCRSQCRHECMVSD